MGPFNRGIIITLVSLALSLGGIFHGATAAELKQGEKLVHQLWTLIKERNVKELATRMGPGFQSIHEDGARNREQELQLLAKVNIGKYELSKLKITQNGSVIIATYFVSVEETLRGKRLTATKPAARMSAWLETDSGWKWILHANLRSLK